MTSRARMFSFVWLLGACTVACTSILGDFEVVPGDAGSTNQSDTGTTEDSGAQPETSTTDAGPDTNPPPPQFAATWISAGQNHTCAVKPPGHVYCWGDGALGQLGFPPANLNGKESRKPIRVPNLGPGTSAAKPITKVFVGGTTSCAIDTDQALFCWGGNDSGQLGAIFVGAMRVDAAPVKKGDGSSVVGVDSVAIADHHVCAVLSSGDAFCWGTNQQGQIGVAVQNPPMPPTKVPTVQFASRIAVGTGRSCAHSQNTGKLWCWGRNEAGELGQNVGVGTVVPPSEVNFASTPQGVAAGLAHTCTISGNPGRPWCFGRNDFGQLGSKIDAGFTSTPAPATFSPATPPFGAVSLGGNTGCALPIGDHPIACWGANDHGQLGNGQKNQLPNDPGAVANIPVAKMVSVGANHTCAIRREPPPAPADAPGQVFCWGSNNFGKSGVSLNDISDILSPMPVLSE